MAVRLVCAVRVNRSLPIVDFVGKIVKPETNMTTEEILFAALKIIEKVELYDGVLLEYAPKPIVEGKHFYFSAGFHSYSELTYFVSSIKM